MVLLNRTRRTIGYWEVEITFYDGSFLHGNRLQNEEPRVGRLVLHRLAAKFNTKALSSVILL